MPSITTFKEANRALERYWPKHLSPRLRTTERAKRLLSFLGNPQEKMRVVHVAGTSGKTSTAYYAAALLEASGHRVGLVASPHVDEVNERVQINMLPLEEKLFCRDLEQFLALVEESRAEPHYFEVMVAFAFWEFARYRLEYAVVEVGMGGLSDPTNVVERADKVCVITDIGLDHQRALGNTVAEIAAHKAGIIRMHNTVFCHYQGAAVLQVIQTAVQRCQADLHIVDDMAVPGLPTDMLQLFQRRNFALAHAAVAHTLQTAGGHLMATASKQAAKTHIPARMEIRQVQGKVLVLDAAHNPQKMAMLANSLRDRFGDLPMAALVSFAPGATRATNNLRQLTPFIEHFTLTSFGDQEDAPFASIRRTELEEACRNAYIRAYEYVQPEEALKALLKRPEPVLLVTGSFFLLADVRKLLAGAV